MGQAAGRRSSPRPEHLPDSSLAAPGSVPVPAAAAHKAPPQLIDAVLQRAVQLHRTLLALKKI